MTDRSVDTSHPPLGLALGSLLRADSTVLLRSRVSAVVGILVPMVILVATTLGKSQSRLGGSALVIGLALTLGLITSSLLGYSLAVAHDRDTGVLQRLRVTPAPTWTIMTSRLCVHLAANLVASAILVVVGPLLHNLALSAGQYASVLALAVLGGAVFLAIGQTLVALVKSANAVAAVARILFIILVLLGLLGGTGILGDTMKSVAGWTPVGALMTLFSDVLDRSTWSSQDTYSILACFGYIVVFTFVGIRWFRWDSR